MPDPWATQQQASNPFGGSQQPPNPTWVGPGSHAGQPGQARGPQPPSLNEAVAGSGAQAAFNKDTPIGIIVRGVIVDAVSRQARFNGQLKFFDDGNPIYQIVVRIKDAEWSQDGQTYQPLRTTPDDTGMRAFYIKTYGDNLRALQDAIAATGHTDADKALAPGTMFAGKHTGRKSVQGGNDELLYAYRIGGDQPPAQQVAQPTQQGATPQQAPAQQTPWPAPGPQEEPPF